MKQLLILISAYFLTCCSSKKDDIKYNHDNLKAETEYQISTNELNITSDFLKLELNDKIYEHYKDYKITVRKESIGKLYSSNIYKYCYNERDLPIKSSTNTEWILNDKEIEKIYDLYKNEKRHSWKESDFSAFKVSIIEAEEIKKSITENTYITLPKKLYVYLTTPLIIDDNTAFMSFRTGDSAFGFNTINTYTALLKKNKKGNWNIDSYYYDPNSTW